MSQLLIICKRFKINEIFKKKLTIIINIIVSVLIKIIFFKFQKHSDDNYSDEITEKNIINLRMFHFNIFYHFHSSRLFVFWVFFYYQVNFIVANQLKTGKWRFFFIHQQLWLLLTKSIFFSIRSYKVLLLLCKCISKIQKRNITSCTFKMILRLLS